MLEMGEWDARNLRLASEELTDSYLKLWLRGLAEEIEEAMGIDAPEITLPGPDGEPNELVPMDFFS